MSKWILPKRDGKNHVLFKNARVIDPSTGLDFHGAILVRDGVIIEIAESIVNVSDDCEIHDCEGLLLSPGLLDIQVHFREPGFEHKEDLHSGSKAAVAGGVTTVVCQPNTDPVIDSVYVLSYLQEIARQKAFNNVLFYQAVSKGMKGEELTEMLELKKQGAVGFTDDGLPVANSLLMKKALEKSAELDLVIAQHAEDLVLSDGGCINHGEVAEKLGVKGIPNASEAIVVERDMLLCELVPDAHYHLLHAGTRQEMEAVIRAKKKDLNVTCEVSPHHLFLTDQEVLRSGTNAKMNPPLRSEEDRAFLEWALLEGWIDCIATDHAPHEQSAKDLPIEKAAFGVIGVETMLPICLKLFHDGKISLLELFKKMTCAPADVIRQKNRGRIQKDCIADFALIDLNHEWTINPQKLNSKSKNTPFGGWNVKGKVRKTFFGGELVFQDDF